MTHPSAAATPTSRSGAPAPRTGAGPVRRNELRATYRLQLHAGFGFRDALAVVPYLRDLGISHLYLSPSMTARPGSMHGYDVIDPTTVSEELGGEAALRELADAGLGIILDIVPNHMATDDANPWWSDLERRQKFFDVDPETGWHRRFFDVDELAGVRQEDPEVFAVTHAKVLELVADGVVDGLRVDHPDGLVDPAGYLDRLRDAGVADVWVEKILHPGEPLRDWPVSGTTGYEFVADATALFVDPAGEGPLTELYRELTGETRSFAELAAEAKREQAAGPFAREVRRLRDLAPGVDGIEEAVAALPVYRTYVEPWSGRVTDADRAAVAAAGMSGELARILLLDERGHDELVTRFQQTTSPVTAKGVEDTAFYRYHRLLALNEVGGDPGRFSVSVDDFHAANQERQARFPRAMLGATTHDTKRSLDTRARIGALAGMAGEFADHVRRWFEVTEELVVDGAPDRAERWLLFQTLLGAWPITTDRLDAYLEKALREAKRNTSWIDPDHAWEERVKGFATALLTHPGFLADFRPFEERVAVAGEQASLGQVLLRATVPGVPDTYQGDEEWFLGLVDPDNRRPLDWAGREATLKAVRDGAEPTRATAKLHVLHHALDLRRRRPEPFEGGYAPVEAGPDTVAFLRGDAEVLVIVPLRDDDRATLEVPSGTWADILVPGAPEQRLGGVTYLADLLGPLGIACYERR
ncbi:MAG: treY [Acidimicrobiales bacterium]|nr:treY [Acidimicrobiales bacterium]